MFTLTCSGSSRGWCIKPGPGSGSGQSVMVVRAGTTLATMLVTLSPLLLLMLVTRSEAWPQLYRLVKYMVAVVMLYLSCPGLTMMLTPIMGNKGCRIKSLRSHQKRDFVSDINWFE